MKVCSCKSTSDNRLLFLICRELSGFCLLSISVGNIHKNFVQPEIKCIFMMFKKMWHCQLVVAFTHKWSQWIFHNITLSRQTYFCIVSCCIVNNRQSVMNLVMNISCSCWRNITVWGLFWRTHFRSWLLLLKSCWRAIREDFINLYSFVQLVTTFCNVQLLSIPCTAGVVWK